MVSGAGQTEDEPDDAGSQTRTPHHCRRDDQSLCRLRGGNRARSLHGLYRHRRAIDEAAHDHGQTKGQQDSERVHLEHTDVGDDEGNERAEIAEGTGHLHAVEAVGDWR